ncbi:MAG TPA: DotU family type IV/VI secretion system protein [Kofleriaceae bacterium]|nr:DotU family type IV/VI secretion system protein [Kofleriaceae bacterium]
MTDDPRWVRVQMWRPVREVLEAADALFEEAARLREASEDEPTGVAGAPPPAPPAAYMRRRTALREALEGRLDPELTEALGLWQKHLAMIAITSFADERERCALGPLADAWRLPLLQSELVEIDDGGDRTFAQLEELLRRADVHALIFEMHLYCLRAGFVGRFRDRRHDLERLQARVAERVVGGQGRRPPAPPSPAPAPAGRRVGFMGFPLRYYLGALAAVIALFVGLRITSSREVSRSKLADYCAYRVGDERGEGGGVGAP